MSAPSRKCATMVAFVNRKRRLPSVHQISPLIPSVRSMREKRREEYAVGIRHHDEKTNMLGNDEKPF